MTHLSFNVSNYEQKTGTNFVHHKSVFMTMNIYEMLSVMSDGVE